ncbi:hypothetical protein BDW02DRAFT_643996 [Decorospora gaudefroyi]|uniref:Rhodopsin domain-containing protein n=1 Tax=Decorospora gaudefroyi TaxID=184978 RepID=A0A6A5KV10_9PLEO|nr:hypothetical protein BDW02DRAFT_643996 [Decorospora gaudefroyi]
MLPQDYAGRIHRDAFVISTSLLLALVLLAVATRFLVRFRMQKLPFSADDGLLLVALALVLISVILTHLQVLDRMYLVIGLQMGVQGIAVPTNWVDISYQFHKWVTVVNMCSWTAVIAVKFSFLFFFKKLIDRLPVLNCYWWFVVVFNLGCLGYGTAVYYIGCPYYFDPRELECAAGHYKAVLVNHSVAQMVLDLVGDALILAIPICVIWTIKVQWTQKVALMSSLCLTVFMMITTIARVAGLIHNDMVDSIWEIYWTIVSAEVGVFMAAATAFRSFFVARNNIKGSTPRQQAPRFFSASFVAKFNRKKRSTMDDSLDTQKESPFGLPKVPRAQMTGLRTFIDEQGRIQTIQSHSASSTVCDNDEYYDLRPLHSSSTYRKEPAIDFRTC